MKLLIKLLFVLVIGAVIAPLFIKGPDGQPLMKVTDLVPAEIIPANLAESLNALTGSSSGSHQTPPAGTTNGSIYRWQDDKGQWHYSDIPPAHIKSENVTLKPVNTVPAQPTETEHDRNAFSQKESDQRVQTDNGQKSPQDLLSDLQDGLSPTDAAALLEQAQKTQRIIQERQAQIDALMQNQ